MTLVTGPVALPTPYGVARVDVKTAAEMAAAIERATERCDALVMAAAPADFRPAEAANQKIKRTGEGLTRGTRRRRPTSSAACTAAS